MPLCGPKLSICCTILSLWGIIQLALMGLFFFMKSVALVDDVGLSDILASDTWDDDVDSAYKQRAYNCWIAVVIYMGSFAFSLFQVYLNKRANYQV